MPVLSEPAMNHPRPILSRDLILLLIASASRFRLALVISGAVGSRNGFDVAKDANSSSICFLHSSLSMKSSICIAPKK